MTTFNRDNLPELPLEQWPTWQKTAVTRALRMEGPFEVATSEGTLTCQDGYLAIDARGYPYPIAADEFELIYQPAAEPSPQPLTHEEAAWLLVLVDNAVPREPGTPLDWEGEGRRYAESLLRRAAAIRDTARTVEGVPATLPVGWRNRIDELIHYHFPANAQALIRRHVAAAVGSLVESWIGRAEADLAAGGRSAPPPERFGPRYEPAPDPDASEHVPENCPRCVPGHDCAIGLFLDGEPDMSEAPQ